MMSCAKVRNLLSAYVDGELESREMAAVRAHLQMCPSCCAECDEIRSIREKLHRLPQKAAPPDLLDRIKTRLQEADEPIPQRLQPGFAATVVMAAAAVLGAFAVYSVMHPSQEYPIAGEAPAVNGSQLDGVRDFERSRSPFSSHSIPVSLDDHSWGR